MSPSQPPNDPVTDSDSSVRHSSSRLISTVQQNSTNEALNTVKDEQEDGTGVAIDKLHEDEEKTSEKLEVIEGGNHEEQEQQDFNEKESQNTIDQNGVWCRETLQTPTNGTVPTLELSEKAAVRSPSPPPPPPKDDKYLSTSDQTTHIMSDEIEVASPSKEIRQTEDNEKEQGESTTVENDDAQSEIQSIMEQFSEGGGIGEEEIMSPRLEFAGPVLHPPRKSSLEPLTTGNLSQGVESSYAHNSPLQSPPPRSSSLNPSSAIKVPSVAEQASIPHRPSSIHKVPPPEPDPEPDLPFDFHRFLEQLRHRTADPVAKFLRSFLYEFGKKQWMVHEQVKIISDFLEFISKKMAMCEIWRTVSDAEFDNAREGMEKLVMNRLYTQTFSPAIAPPEPVTPGRKGKRGAQLPLGPGRRGQHQEDVERDEVLAQKVSIYGWVKEEHLDIKPVEEKGRKFLTLAQQELKKIENYRAPRDKVICILNCCKGHSANQVATGFLRNAQSDQSADSFVPLLIYTVLHANPSHLVSNVQYILRFRNQDKLGGEAGYYISSLMGAIQFIENLDRTSLTISDVEFEAAVEAAVSAIAERHSAEEERERAPKPPPHSPSRERRPSPHIPLSEKSTLSRPEVTPRNSMDAERVSPRRSTSSRGVTGESDEENTGDAVAGLLRTMKKPLSTIGRIFSDDNTATTQTASAPRLSPIPPQLAPPGHIGTSTPRIFDPAYAQSMADAEKHSTERQIRESRLSAEDSAAMQASAEAEEARRIQRKEHKVLVETLQGMFPGLDKEVISDVVREKEGRIGLAVDACLALSN
ncbi:hypothetical protein M501DRAFT_944180 [Patellaria atrata CBS 101060]|uniref:VPS9 domain-containing protein n=1 Tax=Patellaria atrata CBS 101060 TaxID=1346257 RepID=A0A9P4VIU0_9PEZI|nr:hypothetical protein M501DRAFT_944180 [Patellaria atrata CBS 101060]